MGSEAGPADQAHEYVGASSAELAPTFFHHAFETLRLNALPACCHPWRQSDGCVVEKTCVETAGEPVKLVLTPDRNAIRDNGTDVVVTGVSTVDAQRRHVPTADKLVSFSVTGGTMIEVGNGDPASHESEKGSERQLFNGWAQVIMQSTCEHGLITLAAQSDDLACAETANNVK